MTHGPAGAGRTPAWPATRREGLALRLAIAALAAAVAAAAGAGLPASLLVACACLAAGAAGRAPPAARGAGLPVATQALLAEARRGDLARTLALELSADRVAAVLDSLREGVIVVDGAAEVVIANPEARHALRVASAAAVGRTLWDVLPDPVIEHARRAWNTLNGRDSAATRRDDATVRFAGVPIGSRVYDLTAVRVRSRTSGHDFGTVFLFVDTTRNHELVQLKDRFLSSISHELRTPLTNICAYAEILQHLQPGETAEWPEFLRIVHEEGLQLSRLVDAMFDYLQLENGDAAFAMREVDGRELARAAVERGRARAGQSGIDLRFESVGEVPRIEADAARFAQVCDQLLDNSLKFTPRGGKVVVRVAVVEGHFGLRVDDSGPGVPGSERRAVFEKFSQLRDHLTEKSSGAGLGLATSRAIVSRLGGLMWCEESSLGGAAFVLLFPVVGGPRLQSASLADGAFAAGEPAAAPAPATREPTLAPSADER